MESAQAMGVEVDEPPPENFEVWPDNAESAELFLACRTQWRITSGMTERKTGLDYAAVSSLIQLWGVDNPKQALEDIRVMEAAALSVWRSKDQ